MRTLYLDCVSGIAGDMTLSALVDLGADPDYIRRELAKLPLDPFEMAFEPVIRRGISAQWLRLTFAEPVHDHGPAHSHDHAHAHAHDHRGHDHERAHDRHDHDHTHDHHHDHVNEHSHNPRHHEQSQDHVHANDHHHEHGHGHAHDHVHRKASDILHMIAHSELPPRVKADSEAIFRVIAEAEAKIHGMDPADVHFHEVGAMDSILDIIGVCLALDHLGIERIIVSPVPVGYGKIRIAHGVYPIPAPATAEILRGVPLSAFTAQGELTTPTGAGIAKALASGYGAMPAGTIERIGYGAGTKDFEHPNVLRAVLMDTGVSTQMQPQPLPAPESAAVSTAAYETILVLETQVDDTPGETLGYAMERLFAAGALDVYYTPVYMKKNRPGVLLTVLCRPADAAGCEAVLLQETSTFGVRRSEMKRRALERQWVEVDTPYGRVRVKQAFDGERLVRQSPEYEDAARAARDAGVPLETVYRAVYRRLNEH